MNNRKHILTVLLTAGIAGTSLLYGQAPEEQDIRTIRLLQDDGYKTYDAPREHFAP